MRLYQKSQIYIGEKPGKGICVFASGEIQANQIVEECPVCILSRQEGMLIHQNVPALAPYQYVWDRENDRRYNALVFGYGSLYNHSPTPNVGLQRDFEHNIMRFVSLRDIQAGEELSFDYVIPPWFEVLD